MSADLDVTVTGTKLKPWALQQRHVIDLIVRKTAFDVEARAKGRVPVRTGHLKNSINTERVGELHWRVSAAAEYAAYVEFGTYRTAAQPFMFPAAQAVTPVFQQAIQRVLS